MITFTPSGEVSVNMAVSYQPVATQITQGPWLFPWHRVNSRWPHPLAVWNVENPNPALSLRTRDMALIRVRGDKLAHNLTAMIEFPQYI